MSQKRLERVAGASAPVPTAPVSDPSAPSSASWHREQRGAHLERHAPVAPPGHRPGGLVGRLSAWLRATGQTLMREIAKFGVVGLVALVVDVGLFNLLRYAGGEGPLYDRPLTAKVISVIAATTVAYFGNRFWTFRHRGRAGMGREYLLFFLLNGIGMLIALGCLWFSHYALGLTSPLADNISANVVGLALGTIFRFWSYRRWVFPAIPITESTARA